MTRRIDRIEIDLNGDSAEISMLSGATIRRIVAAPFGRSIGTNDGLGVLYDSRGLVLSMGQREIVCAVERKPEPEETDPASESCETCRFRDSTTISGADENRSPCTRRAPVTTGHQMAEWPFTDCDDWCGEWEAKVKP